ncbi:hypothetical protein, conserved [Trypanosoma brucei brucei TREU927]|uniref:Uncharacterized protein n=1 Tax=Trypanosoma brucei brucei (strain 927/4 GUTat10.1) TaxID=185431 RepID=Q38BJ9_TRYB2|nr:hypothetical protein, conserved [Trypanosoma brucei brucei TREU927]EAN77821.1 hypothetical protein, conserved [Trypanosoma brucei brucei TREU927]
MSSALQAARSCANTILWQSLRIDAFQGATPHVLLVVDHTPCTLQKVLLEGYIQELNRFNGEAPEAPNVVGPLRVGLHSSAKTPCFSKGFKSNWRVTYGVLPFKADRFLDDVRTLQAFLRLCGHPSDKASSESVTGDADGSVKAREKMRQMFDSLSWLLTPEERGEMEWEDPLFERLCNGSDRELLGCILIQRNAFQNELDKYRLRLDLFNMGLRVAEHNHLEIMSASADDVLASKCDGDSISDDTNCCLDNDELVHYMRSCSFKPDVAEAIGRAIADSIDVWSWSRKISRKEENGEGNDCRPLQVVPPASFQSALSNEGLWSLYSSGVLTWKGRALDGEGDGGTDGSVVPETSFITGPGAPLRIICCTGQVLTYDGGMEDCLLNTGYYAAAHASERNMVQNHRLRFAVHHAEPSNQGENAATAGAEEAAAATLLPMDGVGDTGRHGRLKKKEYLAMLKLKGAKDSTKCGLSHSCEEDVVRASGTDGSNVAGACVGSSIGGTFPVGEVISESFDLSKLNGTCDVFAYPSLSKAVTMAQPKPATLTIVKGVVTDISPDAPDELVELIELVRQTEGSCYVRELGIGLSPYLGRDRVVSDVTAFERQFGVHLSLGQRHPLFVKQSSKRNADGSVAVSVDGPVLKRRAGKYHIDVFLDAARLEMGDFTVDFTKGLVSSSAAPAAFAG